jgi:hypothetical protein
MKLTNNQGNTFISPEDLTKLHDGIKILLPLKTKYYKLGKIISSSEFPIDIKNQFFSFGREIEKVLALWAKFGDE